MALPETIGVRISSEAAGSISITPVVAQTIALRELVWIVLSTTGKDAPRVSEVLARGAVVRGASRFRWQPLGTSREDLDALLRTFPDPDPSRAFRREQCTAVHIHAGRHVIELPEGIASKRRLFRRRSFWDALMDLAERSQLQYVDYSYRQGTDDYRLRLTPQDAAELQRQANLLRYSSLIAQLRGSAIAYAEFSVRFPEAGLAGRLD